MTSKWQCSTDPCWTRTPENEACPALQLQSWLGLCSLPRSSWDRTLSVAQQQPVSNPSSHLRICNCAQEKGGRPGSAHKGRRKGAKAAPAEGAAAAPALAPSYDELACEYHAAMVAGLSLICARAPALLLCSNLM